MSGTSYSKHPFNPLLSSSHLKEFTVLDVQLDHPSQRANREITEESNIVMGDVEVIRSDDFGVSNDTIIVRSHLCGVLEPGMLVMGYDLRRSALNNDEYEKYSDLLPETMMSMKSTRTCCLMWYWCAEQRILKESNSRITIHYNIYTQ